MRIGLASVNRSGCEPTSILFLASWINARTIHQAEIIDANINDDMVKLACSFDLIGVTAMTCDYEAACRFAFTLKTVKPRLPVIIGGVHISTLPESLRPCFDSTVIGEGEIGLADMLEYAHPNTPLDLSCYPPLDRSLIDKWYFRKRFLPGLASFGRASALMGSRGCPYRCAFCASPAHWKGYREFSVDWIMGELSDMANRGVTHVTIFDDVFTLNKSRLQEFAVAKERLGLKHMTLSVNSRINKINDDTCDILRDCNVRSVMFGWESGSQRILKELKGSGVTVAQNVRSIQTCSRHGLMAVGGIIFGTPGENRFDALASVLFIWKAWLAGACSISAFKLIAFPGTRFWDKTMDSFDSVNLCPQVGIRWWIRFLIWIPINGMKITKFVKSAKWIITQ